MNEVAKLEELIKSCTEGEGIPVIDCDNDIEYFIRMDAAIKSPDMAIGGNMDFTSIYERLMKLMRARNKDVKTFKRNDLSRDSIILLYAFSISVYQEGDGNGIVNNSIASIFAITDAIIRHAQANQKISELIALLRGFVHDDLYDSKFWEQILPSNNVLKPFHNNDLLDTTLYSMLFYAVLFSMPDPFRKNALVFAQGNVLFPQPFLDDESIQLGISHQNEFRTRLSKFFKNYVKKAAMNSFAEMAADTLAEFIRLWDADLRSLSGSTKSLEEIPLFGEEDSLDMRAKNLSSQMFLASKPNNKAPISFSSAMQQTLKRDLDEALLGFFFLSIQNHYWCNAYICGQVAVGFLMQKTSFYAAETTLVMSSCAGMKVVNGRIDSVFRKRKLQCYDSAAKVIDLFNAPDRMRSSNNQFFTYQLSNFALTSAFGYAPYEFAFSEHQKRFMSEEMAHKLALLDVDSPVEQGALCMLYLIMSHYAQYPPRFLWSDVIHDEKDETSKDELKEEVQSLNARVQALEEELNQTRRQLEKSEEQLLVKDGQLAGIRAENTELSRQMQSRERELSQVYEQKKELQEAADELLQALESEEEPLEVFDEAEEEVSETNPAFLNGKRVVVVGGHPEFLSHLQMMLPDVILIPPGKKPESAVLASADVVFIQPRCVSHSNFYYTRDICRERNIPALVFKSSGAKTCAQTVLDKVRRM